MLPGKGQWSPTSFAMNFCMLDVFGAPTYALEFSKILLNPYRDLTLNFPFFADFTKANIFALPGAVFVFNV